MKTNRQVTLASRPAGFPQESNFRIVEAPLPTPGEGEVVLRTVYLSVDPYMRGRMKDAPSYAPHVEIGGVMVGGAVSCVEESRYPRLSPGDFVTGNTGWQEYSVSAGKELRKIDPALAPVSTAIGVLGMPGLTAYFGLLDICSPKAGETVVVSGAAGAVGSIAGQIAKIQGCRVVGTCGSDSKVEHVLRDLGFDAAFNYKTAGDYSAKLKELCPDGIDCYFDNVGGALTDAVIRNINVHARISLCGQISQYNLEEPETGPRLLFQFIVKQAKLEGFLVFHYAERYREGLVQLAAWLKEGKLHYRENIVDGLENAPRAFIEMLRGANTGKQLVRVSPE
jgi:NADPH:quinone reductase